jgi:hypothetical protein
MTFEQFQASGRDSNDLSATCFEDVWEEYTTPPRGRIYADSLWIERKPEHGWQNDRPEQWYLIIGNAEYFSDNLSLLERHLYKLYLACI